MENRNWGFCELSIDRNFPTGDLKKLGDLGYHTITINSYVEEATDEPKKKKKKGDLKEKKDAMPAPLEIPQELSRTSKLNILQRITIEFSDSSIAHKMNQSENLKKFDIIAVVPKTLQAFQYACGTMDVDVITFDPQTRIPFKISRKLYRQAVERGLFFELMYAQAIRDSTARKNIISTAHTYHAIGKSKNIFISSGAENLSQVRNVHDVINLGFLLGLNSNESLNTVKNNARRLILKSEGRRYGKHYMKVETVQNNDNKTIDK
ncbi:ribonuclease P protein subunit p30 [Plodia interpunctella]|uniref:ribonuclease P protein subunit p30 n=1 Tax=Plodia interpunctella TaxID=58824 RepID=UPI002368D4B8|nr:ribonuclease P protein subunit p30 [Plodia interpunctella]